MLDEVENDIPLSIMRFDCHQLWVNTKCLEWANINNQTISPEFGVIEIDSKGNLTGILSETAMFLVYIIYKK